MPDVDISGTAAAATNEEVTPVSQRGRLRGTVGRRLASTDTPGGSVRLVPATAAAGANSSATRAPNPANPAATSSATPAATPATASATSSDAALPHPALADADTTADRAGSRNSLALPPLLEVSAEAPPPGPSTASSSASARFTPESAPSSSAADAPRSPAEVPALSAEAHRLFRP
ncbi:unnamed protein product [Closterium sp. NIES-54]